MLGSLLWTEPPPGFPPGDSSEHPAPEGQHRLQSSATHKIKAWFQQTLRGLSPPGHHPAAGPGALCGPLGHLNLAASPPDT